MDETQTQRFNELYERARSGGGEDAIEGLRQLSQEVENPWDKGFLIFQETLWDVGLGRVAEAKTKLGELQAIISTLPPPPPDDYRDDLEISLKPMAMYAELSVLFIEERDQVALQIADELLARYPKHLSMPSCGEIYADVQLHRALLLSNFEKWNEARPLLESASGGEKWKSLVAYYLGRCYYELKAYTRAKSQLMEAVNLGLAGVWLARAHYLLGIVQYHLGAMAAAKNEFELSIQAADEQYLATTKIWEWLTATSKALGLNAEAERHRRKR